MSAPTSIIEEELKSEVTKEEIHKAELFVLSKIKPKSGNLRTGIMQNDFSALLMAVYSKKENVSKSADIAELKKQLSEWEHASETIRKYSIENTELKKQVGEMADPIKFEAIKNSFINVNEAVLNFLNILEGSSVSERVINAGSDLQEAVNKETEKLKALTNYKANK